MAQISSEETKQKCPRRPPCAFRPTCKKAFKAEDAIFCRDYCVHVTKGEHPRVQEGIFRTSQYRTGRKDNPKHEDK